jgi:hypothetical protein
MTRRAVALLAALLLPATGCSGDDDATATTVDAPISNPTLPPSSTTSTVEPTASSTTTLPGSDTSTTLEEPAPTTTPPAPATTESPPPTTSEGDPDWLAIVQGLSDALNRLQQSPSVEGVDDFCAVGENDCRDTQGQTILQFVSEGWRAIDLPAPVILAAELSATESDLPLADAAFVVISVTTAAMSFGDARVVDSAGELVFEIVAEGEENGGRANWLLARGEDANWQVLAIRTL